MRSCCFRASPGYTGARRSSSRTYAISFTGTWTFGESFENVATHYVLLTWLYDAFNELPYLRLRGDYGSGKTRALLTIGSLCYKGFFASGASTVSPIFHTLDAFRGTLIFDEADFVGGYGSAPSARPPRRLKPHTTNNVVNDICF